MRCTRKLLDVIRAERLATPQPDGEDWYAKPLVLDRRKCLLLTHASTLFTVFEPDVRAATLRATHDLVVQLAERELLHEALSPNVFGELRAAPLLHAKTADRSVLGCMNDIAFHCKVAAAKAGSLSVVNVHALNHGLLRNINSARDYERPIDLVAARAVASP
jgi:hypothetical protein